MPTDHETLVEAVSTLENYGDHHDWCEKADRLLPQWETARCTCGYDAQLKRLQDLAHPPVHSEAG